MHMKVIACSFLCCPEPSPDLLQLRQASSPNICSRRKAQHEQPWESVGIIHEAQELESEEGVHEVQEGGCNQLVPLVVLTIQSWVESPSKTTPPVT